MHCRRRPRNFSAFEIAPDTCIAVDKKGRQRTVNTFRLSYSIDDAALDKEQRLHGVSCFITNLPERPFPAKRGDLLVPS